MLQMPQRRQQRAACYHVTHHFTVLRLSIRYLDLSIAEVCLQAMNRSAWVLLLFAGVFSPKPGL